MTGIAVIVFAKLLPSLCVTPIAQPPRSLWCWAASAEMIYEYLVPEGRTAVGQCTIASSVLAGCTCGTPDDYPSGAQCRQGSSSDCGDGLGKFFAARDDVAAGSCSQQNALDAGVLCQQLARERSPIAVVRPLQFGGVCGAAGHVQVVVGMARYFDEVVLEVLDPAPSLLMPAGASDRGYVSYVHYRDERSPSSYCPTYSDFRRRIPTTVSTPAPSPVDGCVWLGDKVDGQIEEACNEVTRLIGSETGRAKELRSQIEQVVASSVGKLVPSLAAAEEVTPARIECSGTIERYLLLAREGRLVLEPDSMETIVCESPTTRDSWIVELRRTSEGPTLASFGFPMRASALMTSLRQLAQQISTWPFDSAAPPAKGKPGGPAAPVEIVEPRSGLRLLALRADLTSAAVALGSAASPEPLSMLLDQPVLDQLPSTLRQFTLESEVPRTPPRSPK